MSQDLLDELKETLVEGLTSRTLNSCYRWAAHRRIMAGDFAGHYSDTHHPWVREMHDSWAPFNYAMKAAQLGVTEVAINRALYTIDRLQRDVLYVLPTSLNASDFSKARFGAALALSPYIRRIFTDTNTVNLKQAGSNTLYIRGSRGDTNLKSIPASELILDEVDEMEQRQIWLALERLSGQLHKHVWAISTPTIPEYGIHKLYEGSTKEHFTFECPACSRWTELIWPDCVELIGEHATDIRCAESYLKCKECKAKLEQMAKPTFLRGGKWVSFANDSNPEVRGFHINQLYSFTVDAGELAVAYFRGFGDEWAAKNFHNSKLGLPFIGDGARVDDVMIERSIRNHSKEDSRPSKAGRLITLGVDQGKTNYAVVCEWFPQHKGIDINASCLCTVLWEGTFTEDEWGRLDELMAEWQVMACVIDADPQINEARRFARRYAGYVWLCRYRRGQTAREIAVTEEDGGAPLATVDRTNWLTATLGRFKTDPSRVYLPRDVSHAFREHVKNLVRTYEKGDDGNPTATFVSVGADHFAHALAYAEIALPFAPAGGGSNITKVL